MNICRIDGCDRVVNSRGMCKKHYFRAYCGFDPSVFMPRQQSVPRGGLAELGVSPNHPFYNAWCGMWARCKNPTNRLYKRYGGRGISVCESWRTFKAFYDDMFKTWSKGLMIDRENNDGNYCKENCRWVTREVSNRNRCCTVMTMEKAKAARWWYAYGGRISNIAKVLEVSPSVVQSVLDNKAWISQ